jgi:tetratricopeptide (TPR) repeat protein
MKNKITTILVGVSIFLICGAPSIRFNALFPAFAPVPSHIKSVGLVNRTATDEKLVNIIEGSITGEIIGQDKALSQRVLEGVNARLKESADFEVVKVNEALIRDGILELFPDQLSWQEVHKICQKNNTDALIVMELYDSDYPLGTNTVIITAGFRFYDAVNEMVYDEYILKNSLAFRAPNTNTILGTLNKFVQNADAAIDASFEAGVIYAQRISPSWFSVERKYYKRSKGDQNMAIGARMMEANNWDGAIEALTVAAENGHRKTKGRACHNLAVVYEILGELDLAKEWAQKAYTNYKNKDSKYYVQVLNNRIIDVNMLKSQYEN